MPRVFIIANGQPDFPQNLKGIIGENDVIVCADGGSSHATTLGVSPNIILGDMDSSSPEILLNFQSKGADIRRFPRDKDASDLELALTAALEFSPFEITCLSVLGNREDHALTNTFLLARFAGLGHRITAMGANWQAQFITTKHPRVFDGKTGDILSLIPMVATVSGVEVRGVKWPLENATLQWGSSRTVSNEFLENQVSVSLSEGLMLAYHYQSVR